MYESVNLEKYLEVFGSVPISVHSKSNKIEPTTWNLITTIIIIILIILIVVNVIIIIIMNIKRWKRSLTLIVISAQFSLKNTDYASIDFHVIGSQENYAK